MFEKWKEWRKERQINKINQRAWVIVDGRPYDIVLLYKRSFISVNGVGQDITSVNIEIENFLRKPVVVAIKPGAYFQSMGSHQNMATTKFYQFELQPAEKRSIAIDAACINASLAIPGEDDGFAGVEHVSTDVALFLEHSCSCDSRTVQAGVWAITDRMIGYDIKKRLVGHDADGNVVEVISDHHVEEAKEILDRLGISNSL